MAGAPRKRCTNPRSWSHSPLWKRRLLLLKSTVAICQLTRRTERLQQVLMADDACPALSCQLLIC
jgi:hypothetical protein